MKRIVWIFLAAALALVSCQKHERAALQRSPGEVRFTTSLDRYSVKATDTAFESGDQVGIFAGAPISVDNVKAAVSGTSLTPETAIRWVEDDNSVVSFYAYYPYASDAVKAYAFTVAADQSAAADYKKSDLMVAAAQSAPTENAVALNFHHALSKVALTVDNQIAGTTVSQLEFCGVALGATLRSDAETMPSFLASCYGPSLTDVVVPENAPNLFIAVRARHNNVAAGMLALFLEWKKAGANAEMYIYDDGQGPFGPGDDTTTSGAWREHFYRWMVSNGWVIANLE